MEPDVSVVIPTRNRSALLFEAVESIRAQTSASWEVVIVDDASDDGSCGEARAFVRDDRRLRLVALDTRSERSTARNTGLEHVAGRFVLFLDDDDRLLPEALSRLAAALDRHRDAAVAIGARRMFDEQGQARRAPHPRLPVERRLWRELLVGWVTEWVAVPGQCMFRSDRLREVGAWNATLVGPEDQELLLRVAADRAAIIIPRTVLEYRLHGSQWRPPDVAAQENAFRQDIAARLAQSGHPDAARFVRAGELLRQADRSYDTWEYAQARQLLARAADTAPEILTSPILGPAYVHLYAKCLAGTVAGTKGSHLIRTVRDLVRRSLHRSPEAHVAVLDESQAVPGRGIGYQAAPTAAAQGGAKPS